VDASGVITRYAGDSFPELNLCCPQETIGRSIDATALWLADAVRQSLDSGETSFGVGEAGERRYECRCFVERATEAGPTVATVWISDVTERKRLELALVEQEHLLRDVDVLILKMSRDDLHVEYVTGALWLLGYSPREWRDKAFLLEIAHPDERDSLLGVLRAVAADGVERQCVHRARAADGRVLWFRTRLRTTVSASGSQIAGVLVDITENISAVESLRENESHLRRLLEQLPAIVYTTDRELRFTFGVGQGLAELGLQSQRVLGGVSLHEYLHLKDRDDPALAPHRRALAGESVSYESEWAGRHYQSFVSPFRDVAGEIVGTLAVGWNITERKRIEDTLRLLADASLTLAKSLDYDETLSKVARLAVPAFADWCLIGVLDDDHLRLVAATHVDRAKDALFAEMLPPAEVDALGAIGRVIRTQTPLLVEHVSDDASYKATFGEENPRAAELFRKVGMRSILIVPLVARERSVGVLSLGRAEEGRPYGSRDVSVAEDLGRRCAMAIDSSLLYRSSQEAIQTRDEFLSIASHELRTPLTSLLLRLEAFERSAKEGRELDARYVETSLEVIHRQAKRLSRLVEQLLDVSRMRRGRFDLDREEADLAEILREVSGRLAGSLTLAGCSLSLTAPVPVVGHWDRMRMEQVITNLLSNAIKFARSTAIEAGVEAEGNTARLFVRDRGMGIAPVDQDRIFERFERAASPKHFGGLGLGLYITRQIVEAHGGTIRVASQPGEGSTFVVELPIRR
jgi:PAS domain S-box-containing protein